MEHERKDIKYQLQQGYKLQNLMCLVNKETLIRQHEKQQPNKASGIDKVTKDEYSINLEARIDDFKRAGWQKMFPEDCRAEALR